MLVTFFEISDGGVWNEVGHFATFFMFHICYMHIHGCRNTQLLTFQTYFNLPFLELWIRNTVSMRYQNLPILAICVFQDFKKWHIFNTFQSSSKRIISLLSERFWRKHTYFWNMFLPIDHDRLFRMQHLATTSSTKWWPFFFEIMEGEFKEGGSLM